ncbi:MAG: hypothetical protein JW940_29300, partial [Polyangiaceae bacterium]|nr:hypothetical protein [Polyangiaceae bacterium]
GGSSEGEFIPATDAMLWPRGLALDEDQGVLFVSNGDNTVRAVDLVEGTLWTYAGGGDPVYPSVGDGGLATDALLSNPTHLEVGPDGALYIADTGHDAVRRIDAASGVIAAILSPSSDWESGVVEFYGCGASYGCAMVFDQAGHLFVTAYLWTGDELAQGILRRDADGTLIHVAGNGSGSANDGVEAKRALFTYGLTGLAIDSVGNLYASEGDVHRVRRIDGQSSRIDTVAGSGWSGSTGDYGPATSARLNYAMDLAVTADGSLAIADNFNCAVREVWGLGSQPETPVTLSVAGGDEQSVPVDAAFSAISAHLQASGDDVPGYAVDFRRISGGSWLSANKATTNASGVAAVTGRVGLAVGDYTFEASRLDIHGEHVPGSPVEFTVSATAPDAGTILTIANTAHAYGSFTGPCAGTVARFGSTWAVEAATDGTLYIADDSRVFKLSPAGLLERFAGGGTEQGEFIPATNVAIAPRGLALDEDNGILFISDQNYNTVRAVDVEEGTICTYAGGGAPTYPDIGDGGLATNASLSSPMYLKLGPDGALYIADYGNDAVRRVDADSSVITSIVSRSTDGESGVPALYACGYVGYHCGIAFDEAGDLFVGGYIWTGEQYTLGILRRDPDGTLIHIAGDNSGSTDDGVAATSARLSDTAGLAFDAAGDLWIAGGSGNVIRRIDMVDGRIYTMVGDGTAGDGGDYGPSTDARCYYPYDVVHHPDGHIVFADTDNYAVRMIW